MPDDEQTCQCGTWDTPGEKTGDTCKECGGVLCATCARTCDGTCGEPMCFRCKEDYEWAPPTYVGYCHDCESQGWDYCHGCEHRMPKGTCLPCAACDGDTYCEDCRASGRQHGWGAWKHAFEPEEEEAEAGQPA